jgi:Zn-finger nucleic acid-binding protein
MLPSRAADVKALRHNAGVVVQPPLRDRPVFLDRGELERLIDGESAFYQPPAPSAPPVSRNFDHGGHGAHHGKHKRGGFLSELFD